MPHREEELDLMQIWTFVCAWYRWLVGGGAVFAIVSCLWALNLPNEYESRTLISIPTPVGAQGGIAIAQSSAMLDRIIERFDLKKRYLAQDERAAKLILSSRIKASATKDGLLDLSVRDEKPDQAADLAAAAAAFVRQQILDSHVTEQSKRLFVLQGRLELAHSDLESAARAMDKMELRNKINLDGNAEQILSGFASLDAQYAIGEREGGVMSSLLQLRAELEKGHSNLYRIPSEQLKLLRDFYFNRALAAELKKQVKVAELQAAQDVQVVLPAMAPLEKVGPKRALIVALSALLGLFLTSWLCLILQWRRQRGAC
ncbi:GNVR domain-containing protein [Chromobacterium violaceum]|uniref:GNVR domain-containing protein n=1 Tax=Chromobacterium violaceum TaxID=536 RepID=UPI00385D9D51